MTPSRATRLDVTSDYFTTQLTGTFCAPRNCAAASGAMGVAAAGGPRLTADQFRSASKVSCIPGTHSASGGLFISDVIRVFAHYALEIDYGQLEDPPGYTRWPAPTLADRCGRGFGAVLLGDYDALPRSLRASATFLGDHSGWVHDYRLDKTICWHDPLRRAPIRIPISAAISYWQKAGSPVRGYAGFVRIAIPLPDTATAEEPVKVHWGLENWRLDKGPNRVTTIGSPIRADGTIDGTKRIAYVPIPKPGEDYAHEIDRDRLDEPQTDQDAALSAALAAYALPSADRAKVLAEAIAALEALK